MVERGIEGAGQGLETGREVGGWGGRDRNGRILMERKSKVGIGRSLGGR